MKWCLCASLAVVLPAIAQQTVQSRTYDGVGNAVSMPSSTVSVAGNVTTRTSATRSVNGRTVPVESVEERVVSDDGRTRVVERIVKRYSPDGQPLPGERVRVERQTAADGATIVRTSTFKADFNGNTILAQRSVAETRKNGSATTTNESIERPDINGGLALAEKRESTVTGGPDQSRENTTVYRRDNNGSLYESERRVAETRKTAAGSESNVVTYENSGGSFKLREQVVSQTSKSADGSEQIVENVFRTDNPGVVNTSGKPVLREQRIIGKQVSGTKTTETVDVRRPSLNDPTRLGPAVRDSERVCTGDCKP